LNIPSKRDIDELSEKIAQLAARVANCKLLWSERRLASPAIAREPSPMLIISRRCAIRRAPFAPGR